MGGRRHDPANHVEAVLAAVEGDEWFVTLHVGWQNAEIPGRDIGRHRRDDVERVEA